MSTCCQVSITFFLGWLLVRLLLIPVSLYHAFTFVLPKILIDLIKLGPSEVFYTRKRSKPPACLEDPTLGKHCYAYLKNLRLHFVTNGSEDKPLMLLLHGFPEFWYSWRHQLREFKDSYRVVAVDLRGYGDSDKPTGIFSYNLQVIVDDIEQLVTYLGYDKFILVGHDWGSALAFMFAQSYPERLKRLIVLNGANLEALEKGMSIGDAVTQLGKSWYIFLFQLPWLPEFMFSVRDMRALEYLYTSEKLGVRNKSGGLSDEDVEAYKFNFARNGLTAPINYYRANIISHRPSFRPVTVPTLIICGKTDAFMQSILAENSKDLCTGGVQLKYIDDCSHWVQMDRPTIVNKYIWEYLQDVVTNLD